MKKNCSFIGIGLLSVFVLSSCVTTSKTARTAETYSSIKNATVADLEVSDQRISYTMTSVPKDIRRGGLANVCRAAESEALTANGNYDLLLEPQYVYSIERSLFGSKVTAITVTGRPARYKNFRTLHDSVWNDPGFYGQPKVIVINKGGGDASRYGQYGQYAHRYGDAAAADVSAGIGKGGGIGGALGGALGGAVGKLFKKKHAPVDDGMFRRTGLRLHIDLMGGFEKTRTKQENYSRYYYNETSDGSGYMGALGTIGIQVSPHFFLGVGSGYMHGWDYKAQIIPIFGDLRYYFSRSRNSFFVDYKMGASTQVGHPHVSGGGHVSMDGGAFLSPSFGYCFGGMSLALQFLYQQYKTPDFKDLKINASHVGLVIGFNI